MSFRRHNNARRFGGLFLELEDEPLKVSRSSDPCMRMTRLAVMASAAAGIAFAMQCLGQDALKPPDSR